MKKTTIVFITSEYRPSSPGGASSVPQWIIEALDVDEFEIHVICMTSRRTDLNRQTGFLSIHEMHIPNLYWIGDRVDQPNWKRIIWQLIDTWNPIAYWKMKNLLSRIHPEIVHTHKIRGFSPAVWQAARAAGVERLIHTAHDPELVSPKGTLLGKIGELALTRHWSLRAYQSIRIRAAGAVDVFTAPSRYLLDLHHRLGFFTDKPSVLLPNTHGLSEQDILAAQAMYTPKDSNAPLTLGFLGRVVPEKGLETLLQAFHRVIESHPHIRLHVMGDGPIRAQLEHTYHHENITFHGTVLGDEKFQRLRKLDALVVPSLWAEPFGIVTLEALAVGLPVLGARSGATPELITPDRTGQLFEPGDVAALAALIAEAAERPQPLRAMAPACFQASLAYTREAFIQRHRALYQPTRTPAG